MSRLFDAARKFITDVIRDILKDVTKALLVLLLPFLLVLVLWAIESYNANAQIVLLWMIFVLLVVNILFTFLIRQNQKSVFKNESTVRLIRDAQSGILYLIDLYGKAREIQDEDTSSFVSYALGISDRISEYPSTDISKMRGEKLPKLRNWERPLTPDEKLREELRYKIQSAFEITEAHFDEFAEPQRIAIHVTNRGEVVYVKRILFQHLGLPADALLHSYARSGIFTVIPFNQDEQYFSPQTQLKLDLCLRQKWSRADIESKKTPWGTLRFEVIYDGKEIEDVSLWV